MPGYFASATLNGCRQWSCNTVTETCMCWDAITWFADPGAGLGRATECALCTPTCDNDPGTYETVGCSITSVIH